MGGKRSVGLRSKELFSFTLWKIRRHNYVRRSGKLLSILGQGSPWKRTCGFFIMKIWPRQF